MLTLASESKVQSILMNCDKLSTSYFVCFIFCFCNPLPQFPWTQLYFCLLIFAPLSTHPPQGCWRWGAGSLCGRGISTLPNEYLLWERTYGSWHNRVLHQLAEVWASLFLFCLLWTHLALQLHFWSIYFSHYLHCHPNNLLIFLTLQGHLCASGRRCYI